MGVPPPPSCSYIPLYNAYSALYRFIALNASNRVRVRVLFIFIVEVLMVFLYRFRYGNVQINAWRHDNANLAS